MALAAAIILIGAAPCGASALMIGVGDQSPAMFTSPAFLALHIGEARGNVLHRARPELPGLHRPRRRPLPARAPAASVAAVVRQGPALPAGRLGAARLQRRPDPHRGAADDAAVADLGPRVAR